MKEQYVGDVNDYRKYALLRALSRGEKIPLGVCWMLTPPDGRTDGNKIQYLKQPAKWRFYDPLLFDALCSVTKIEGEDRLSSLEKSGILPNTCFFNVALDDDLRSRESFFAQASARLRNTQLVFYDPDNGIEIPSKPKGHRNSAKYIYLDEIVATFAQGQSALVYQHFTRENRQHFIERLAKTLSSTIPDASIWTFRSPHVVFILLAHPNHSPHFEKSAVRANSHWNEAFLRCERVYPSKCSARST